MKKQQKEIIAGLLGIAMLLLYGFSYLPLYAQEGAGDQIRGQVETLVPSGEGDEQILTSNWQDIAPDEQRVYRFDYQGSEQPVRVWLNSLPSGAAEFQIWTDELLNALNADPELAPYATGAPISEGSEFSVWQGNEPAPKIFYVTVRSTSPDTAQYQLNISGSGLSPQQPGQEQSTPLPPTPVPPTPTLFPPGPTVTPTATISAFTPLPVSTLPPAPTPLPNVTVVQPATSDATTAVVVAPALNVRSGPSTAYNVITTVPAGTVLTVLGRNEANTWIAVRLDNNTEGWVTRSLTNYTALAPTVLTAEPPPTPTLLPGVTATPTPDTEIVVVQPSTPEALDGNWHVLQEGDTDWYTFQYRGGELPVHVWMDVEPDQGAIFNILDQETALSILAGVAPNVVNAVGRGMANPVEPGYLLWQADFPEADIFYVMVQHQGPGDVVYSVHAAGPGLSRPVPN